jgi:hypothetical protein
VIVNDVMVDKTGKFAFRVAPETLKALDVLRKDEEDLPSRGEMIRRLIDRAAAAKAAKAKKKAD